MPTTSDNQGFLNLISIRRNQVGHDNDSDLEDLELFQKHVTLRFADLLSSTTPTPAAAPASESPTAAQDAYVPPPPPPLLSLSWLRNLLDNFLCCEAEFKAILVSGRDVSQFSKPPLDRLIPDLLDRTVKALDVCNAVSHGVELVLHWQKLAEIATATLQQNPLGEGQVRRARKALTTILTSMVFDDKENSNSSSHGKSTERTWSLARRGGASNKGRNGGQFRPLSWPVAKSWSAAKQLQAMTVNLVAPRGADASGLQLPIYIMSNVLVFVMWALVAAIPCQERNGLTTHLPIQKQLGWAQPISGLHEKIGEDWKKKEKKGNAGLLEEIQRMEKVAQSLLDFSDAFVFPVEEEKAAELATQVAEMVDVCEKMEEGLRPLQQQVREVYHRIVRSRAEVLDVIDHIGTSVPVPY